MLVLGFAALVIPAALDLARFLNMIELPKVERNEGFRSVLVDRIVCVPSFALLVCPNCRYRFQLHEAQLVLIFSCPSFSKYGHHYRRRLVFVPAILAQEMDDEINANTACQRQNHDEREGPASSPTSFDAVNSVVPSVDWTPTTVDSSAMLAALRSHEDAEERSPEAEATPKINVLAAMLSCIADGVRRCVVVVRRIIHHL